jgi:hypothetical protein
MPPTFLIDSLNGIRRRVKMLSVAFGVGVVLAAAVALLLGTVLLDFLSSYLLGVNLPAGMRLLLLAALVVAVGYAAVRWVVKPILARLSLSDVAGHIESVFPQFDDRLRSTVDFVQQPADSIPGSSAMKERVVTEATQLAQNTDLSRAVVTKPVWYSLSTAVAALALLVAVSMLIPPFARIGLPRLFAPFAHNPWPKRVEIDAQKLPSRVPVGQRLDVSLALKKGDKPTQKAFIYYQYDNGPVMKEFMIRGESGRYTASLDARAGSEKLRVWMAAGDDQTDPVDVTVVPRLAIQSVNATVTAPAYAQTPPTTVDLARAPAFMVTGSQVAVRVQFNKALDPARPMSLAVIPHGDGGGKDAKPFDPGVATEVPQPSTLVGNFTAKESFRFRVKATDVDGFENTALEEYEVVVKPDQLPSVIVESPRKNVDRTPDAYLPLQVLAEDDFGVSSVKLIVDRISVAPDPKNPAAPPPADAKKHWEIPLKNWARIDGTGERQRYRLNWDWVLKTDLGQLRPGDVLEYFVEVRDNYQGATAQTVHPPQYSSKLRIHIISEEEMATRVIDEIRTLAAKTNSVHNSQVSNQAETKTLKEDTEKKPDLSKGDKNALEGLTSRQSAIVSQTKSLSGQLDDVQKTLKENNVKNDELNAIAKEAKQDLDQAAEKPMTDAANQLNQAQQQKGNPNDPAQQQKAAENRNQNLDQSQQSQSDAAKRLEQAMDKMNKVGNMGQMISDLQKLLDEQKRLKDELKEIGKETLGKKAEELTQDQKDKLNKNADDQKKLADKMDKATEQMKKMGDQMSKSDPQSAEAMKQAAQQAQNQQISPQQRQAAQQAQKNQQAQAQNAQQQAQIGIEVVLNTLKDAERRKLEQLAKLLNDAVKAIEDLVRRQAGHNLDNLVAQGGDAMTKALTKEEIDVLYVKAKRDQKNPGPAPQLGVITSGQESTERNTRNLAKDVEEKIQGAGPEIAQQLVRAAGKMGYAITDLRDKKLPSAYSPHQVEALNALEQALKKAEDAQQKNQAEMNKRQAETIKAQLEKIRKEQVEKINTPTTEIDKLRKPDGTLGREHAVRLGQLPGVQGKLAEEINSLADALRGLGGIIYESSAKEVAEAMNEVKDDLGKQKTGKTTQLTEARVVEQLDAMIISLKEEKDFSKFNQKGGGGNGGGGGGSKLPTEAELRLLKALQQAVNKNTVAADQLPKDQQDKVALVNLGNRQGKLRGLLDNLIKAATQGKEGLKAEPDPKDKLPEEAGKEAIENKETDDELLGGNPKAEKETKQLNRVGDRMARSRQRLALDNDPGKTTQEIQKRIVVDIDDMIKQAQQQMANNPSQQPKPGQKPGEQQPGQQPGQQQANGQGNPQQNNGQQAAQNSTVSQGGRANADTSAKITETAREWGNISPRLRDAVIDGANEQIPEKYKKMIEDYYRGVATGGKQP